MATGILGLRKLQIAALRASVAKLTRGEIIRLYVHAEIRRQESRYQRETFDETTRLAIALNDPNLLTQHIDDHTSGELRCVRCGHPLTGFRDKKAAGVYQVLGICQKCQDPQGPS